MDDSGGSGSSSGGSVGGGSSSKSSDKKTQGVDEEGGAYREKDPDEGKVSLGKKGIQGVADAILSEIHSDGAADTGWSKHYEKYHEQLNTLFTSSDVAAIESAISNNGGR
jgi:hypothetical protein